MASTLKDLRVGPLFDHTDCITMSSYLGTIVYVGLGLGVLALALLILRRGARSGYTLAGDTQQFSSYCQTYVVKIYNQQLSAVALLLANLVHLQLEAKVPSNSVISQALGIVSMSLALCCLLLLQSLVQILSLAASRIDMAGGLLQIADVIAHRSLSLPVILRAPRQLLVLSSTSFALYRVTYLAGAFQETLPIGGLTVCAVGWAAGAIIVVALAYTFIISRAFMSVATQFSAMY